MSNTLSVGSPRLKNRCRKSIRCSVSELRCAVRFWSLESEFVYVFIIFFLRCAFSAYRPSRKSLPRHAASGSSLQRAPRPALGSISRLWRARGWERAKMDLKTSPNGARGTRNLVAQTESCGVERSPICAGTEAQRERSGDGSSRSKWAIKRNAAVFSLRDKLESGAV
jgi:hypothetical protein